MHAIILVKGNDLYMEKTVILYRKIDSSNIDLVEKRLNKELRKVEWELDWVNRDLWEPDRLVKKYDGWWIFPPAVFFVWRIIWVNL